MKRTNYRYTDFVKDAFYVVTGDLSNCCVILESGGIMY